MTFWILECGLRFSAAHSGIVTHVLRVLSDSRLFGHESEGECEGIQPLVSILLCLRVVIVCVVGDVCIETEWPTRGHFGSRLESRTVRR